MRYRTSSGTLYWRKLYWYKRIPYLNIMKSLPFRVCKLIAFRKLLAFFDNLQPPRLRRHDGQKQRGLPAPAQAGLADQDHQTADLQRLAVHRPIRHERQEAQWPARLR